MANKTVFLPNIDERLDSKTNEELFSFIKSWNINLTRRNFKNRLKKYFDFDSMISKLTEDVEIVPFYIKENLYFIIKILWNRIWPEKIIVNNILKEIMTISNNDDPKKLLAIYDKFLNMVINNKLPSKLLEDLLNINEVVNWLSKVFLYIYSGIIYSKNNELLDHFVENFNQVGWPKNKHVTQIRGLLVEPAVYYYHNKEHIEDALLHSIIKQFPNHEYIIYTEFLQYIKLPIQFMSGLNNEKIDKKIDELELLIEKYQIQRTGIETHNENSEFEDIDETLILDTINKVNELFDFIPLKLSCFDCGLYYNVEVYSIIIDNNEIKGKKLTKTSNRPDNGKYIFDVEVRCPTCNGYKFVIEKLEKSIILGPRISANDEKIQIGEIIYALKSSLSSSSAILKDLKKRYRKNPKDIEIITRLGLSFRKSNYYDNAKRVFLRCLKLDPSNFIAYYNLGEIYLGRGDLKRSKHCFKKTYEIDSEQLHIMFNHERMPVMTHDLISEMRLLQSSGI